MARSARHASLLTVLVAATACSSATSVEAPGATSVPAGQDASAPADSAPDTQPAPTTVDTALTEPPTSLPAGSTPGSTAVPTEAVDAAVERDFAALAPVVASFVDEHGLNGAGLVIVHRDDGIVYEQYWGEFTADRVSLVASSSKMITAGVLMRLHDDGLIDVDAPVAEAADWAIGNPDITVAQLVSNSSGLPGLFPNPAYLPYLCQFLPFGDIEDCAASSFQTVRDDGDVVPPDTEFRYGGVQWQIAGAVAETITGTSWAELIDEIYVVPCGVASLGYGNHWAQSGTFTFSYPSGFDPTAAAPTDNPNMEGGAYIDPHDYATLLLMHLRGGECPDGRVMSAAAIDRMHQDRVLAAYGDAGPSNPGYGMGWWVDRATGQIRDPGAYGSVPWLDLDDGYGAYLVIEADSNLGGELAGMLNPLVEAAMTG